MDPLSFTTSIIAILGVGGTIAKGLQKLHQMKKAPEILLQLNNEITDLKVVVLAVDELCRQSSDPISAVQQEVVYKALQRAKNIVLELELLINHVLTRETTSGSEISRLAWLRSLNKLKEMKMRIRLGRNDLNAAWMAMSSRDEYLFRLNNLANFVRYDSQNIELQIQDLSLTIADIRLSEQAGRNLLDNTISVQNQLLQLIQNIRSDSGTTNPLQKPLTGMFTEAQSHNAGSHSRPMTDPIHSTVLQISVTKLRGCSPLCVCRCHRSYHFRSPKFLDVIIGCLFLGYSAAPFRSQECDTGKCQRLLVTASVLKYVFPLWLLKRMIYVTLWMSKSNGPELIIRCPRVRSHYSSLFQATMQNAYDTLDPSLNKIAHMLKRGEASVLDVTEHGRSALWVSVLIYLNQMYSVI